MNKRKLLIAIIILLISIVILDVNFTKYQFLQEDLLFFKFFYNNNQNYKQIKDLKILQETHLEHNNVTMENIQLQYITPIIFEVEYKRTKLQNINLVQTVNNKTLVNEKIAPGTKGSFDIIIKSKKNINYEIAFKNINIKPQNLQFYTLENTKKYNNLEEMNNILNGYIKKNELKKITIFWEWQYEINKDNNKQDTIDAKKIREYNFLIYVKGA